MLRIIYCFNDIKCICFVSYNLEILLWGLREFLLVVREWGVFFIVGVILSKFYRVE